MIDDAKNPEKSAEELSKKLNQILRRLDLLEELIPEKPKYAGFAAALKLTLAGICILMHDSSDQDGRFGGCQSRHEHSSCFFVKLTLRPSRCYGFYRLIK